MPDTLTINGKDVTPLKLSGTATGGAAFFIATLVFLYATGVNKPGGAPPAPPGPAPSSTPTLAIASSEPIAPTTAVPSVRATPAPPDGDDVDDPAPAASPPITAQAQPRMSTSQQVFRVRTYCSSCCPQGPQNCRNTGVGIAPTLQQAAEIAARYCVASGGHADTCYANVEQF